MGIGCVSGVCCLLLIEGVIRLIAQGLLLMLYGNGYGGGEGGGGSDDGVTLTPSPP